MLPLTSADDHTHWVLSSDKRHLFFISDPSIAAFNVPACAFVKSSTHIVVLGALRGCRSVPEIKVIASLFHAHNPQPRRGLRKKICSLDQCRTWPFRTTTGNLWGYR